MHYFIAIKTIIEQGERVFYCDGEPCDLPEGTRLDERVEMLEGSVWNAKQQEIEEQAAVCRRRKD